MLRYPFSDFGREGACILGSGFFELFRRLSAIPPAKPASAAPPASSGPFALEAMFPALEPPGAFEASAETFSRALSRAPLEGLVRGRVAVRLERRDPDVWLRFDLRGLRVVVEEPFDLLLVELLLLALLLPLLALLLEERLVCVAISRPLFRRFLAAPLRGRSACCYPVVASQTPRGAGVRRTHEEFQSAI